MDFNKKYKIDVNINPLDFGGAFGLPPSSYVSQDYQKMGFPILEITPAIPETSPNLDIFTMNTGMGCTKYIERLGAYGVTLGCSPYDIPFAYLPEGAITDTLTNDYGETFLQEASDVTGRGFSELSQMVGGKSLAEISDNSKKWLEPGRQAAEKAGGVTGKAFGMGIGGLQSLLDGVKNLSQSDLMQKTTVGQVIEKLATGHRFDFPMIWRNSSFAQSYSVTIRLYNPNPSNSTFHRKFILGPLILLMVLALPSSDKAFGYTWPFFVQIRSAGLFNLMGAAITGMTITKGGDQNQITWVGPRVSTIDVKIDFVSLYGTLIDDGMATNADIALDKPNLATYIASLDNAQQFSEQRGKSGNVARGEERNSIDVSRKQVTQNINTRASYQAGVISGEADAITAAYNLRMSQETNVSDEKLLRYSNAYTKTQDITFETSSRIPQDKIDTTNNLKEQQSEFYAEPTATLA